MKVWGAILLFSLVLSTNLPTSHGHDFGPTLQSDACGGTQLEVGGFARLASSEALPGFTGFPYTSSGENALQPATRRISFDYLENRDLFISEGPFCLDGDYIWRIRLIETTAVANTDVWLFETRNGRRLLEASDVDPVIMPAYQPDRVNLLELLPEIAVDPVAQVAPSGFGGGGLDYDSLVFPGSTTDSITQIFAPGLRVTVSIWQPDGTTYSSEDMRTNEYGYLEASLPTNLGLPVGTWRVLFSAAGESREVAYQMKAIVPAMWQACEDGIPVLQFSGFQPNQRFRLVQIATLDGDLNYSELQHWELQADNYGTLIVEDYTSFKWINPVALVMSAGETVSNTAYVDLVVETSEQSWQDNILRVGGWPFTRAILTTYSQRVPECGREQSREPIRIAGEEIPSVDKVDTCTTGEGDPLPGLTATRFQWVSNIEPTEFLSEPALDADVIESLPTGTEVLVTDKTHCNAGLLYRSVWRSGEEGWLLKASHSKVLIQYARVQAQPGIYVVQTGPVSAGSPGQYGIEPGQSFTVRLTVTNSQNNQIAEVLGYTYGDIWGFQGSPNQVFTIRVKSDDFDPIIFVFDPSGNSLAEDDDSAGNLGSLIKDLVVSESGVYVLLVTSVDGESGEYTVEFSSQTSDQSGQASQNPAPNCPRSLPSRLTVGGRASVTPGEANRVRNSPESGDVIGRIPGGETFQVLEGPVCGPNNGLAWWRVDYDGLVGWTAESDNSTYWLVPLE